MGSISGFFGLVILAIAAKTLNVENSEIIQTLKKNPRKIVWVYTVQYTSETTKNLNTDLGKQSLVVLCNDEGNITFQFQTSPSTAEEVLKILEEALPHATFGYTEEIAQKYQNSPTSLRK